LVQNLEIHTKVCVRDYFTQSISNLYTEQLPNCHLFWESTYNAGIKLFNNSLCRVTNLTNEKTQFKVALRRL